MFFLFRIFFSSLNDCTRTEIVTISNFNFIDDGHCTRTEIATIPNFKEDIPVDLTALLEQHQIILPLKQGNVVNLQKPDENDTTYKLLEDEKMNKPTISAKIIQSTKFINLVNTKTEIKRREINRDIEISSISCIKNDNKKDQTMLKMQFIIAGTNVDVIFQQLGNDGKIKTAGSTGGCIRNGPTLLPIIERSKEEEIRYQALKERQKEQKAMNRAPSAPLRTLKEKEKSELFLKKDKNGNTKKEAIDKIVTKQVKKDLSKRKMRKKMEKGGKKAKAKDKKGKRKSKKKKKKKQDRRRRSSKKKNKKKKGKKNNRRKSSSKKKSAKKKSGTKTRRRRMQKSDVESVLKGNKKSKYWKLIEERRKKREKLSH